ncbi:Calcium homeostasis endoplasmic reticulum protein, partial [Tupaia chinensis]
LRPADQELRNVIDKLAQFVARNGPEFEKMTMEKQKDNPKFSFLFGGEFYSYYKYKLALEQQQLICKQQAPELEPAAALPPSEQVTAALAHAVEQQMQKLLEETQLDMTEFDNLLQPIIDTCTKDAISAGKNWMFSNAKSPPHCELMAGHLRNRITAEGAHFELRLHLIYLINDVLHHCQRKQARELLAALQKVVVPIYCTSFLAVEEDKQQKIERLLQLWEKNGYFDDSIIQQLQSPALGLGQYQATLIIEYSSVVQPVQLAFQQQIQNLKTQHEEFPPEQPPYPHHQGGPPHCPPWNNSHEGMWGDMQRPPHFRGPFPPHQQHPQFNQPPHPHGFNRFPPRFMQDDFPPRHPFERPPYPHRFDYPQGDFPAEMGPPHHHPGHRMPHPGINEHPPWAGPQHPDFGPPPHGFNGQPPHMRRQGPPHINHDDPSLVPNVPYFDLPAGLMAPLVKLEDHEYKPLDPKDIRLPPPMPPSERLLAAVEAFYSPPSHDRPRNSEGWEQNGLYEFFRAKMRAWRRKGQEKRNSGPSRSRSRSKSRGRSSSRSNSRSSKSSCSFSRSRSCSRSYSRSRSSSWAVLSLGGDLGGARPLRARRSGTERPGPSLPHTRIVVSNPVTRPRFSSSAGLGSNSAPPVPDSRLGEENKGHQMLVKMGWSGSGGLGAKEQGIQDPIKGGDVRDKWDQYKGVGVALDDPYENYRRNKSYSFIARMKAREECK